jgi:hypothetical protein
VHEFMPEKMTPTYMIPRLASGYKARFGSATTMTRPFRIPESEVPSQTASRHGPPHHRYRTVCLAADGIPNIVGCECGAE